MKTSYKVPAAHTLTVTAADEIVHVGRDDDATVQATVAAFASTSFGPYLLDRTFTVTGAATGVVAENDTSAEIAAARAIIEAIPETDQEDSVTVWNDGGVLKVSTAGV